MSQVKLEEDSIEAIAEIIRTETGVQLGPRHRGMIESRLQKRLNELSLKNLTEYLKYLNSNRHDELDFLIGVLTTHHTYFFREFAHFEFIIQVALPQLIPIVSKRADSKLRIWSAACSKGHEVYSLAMVLDATLKKMNTTIDYEILGTDIDPESIKISQNGVYQKDELKEVPMNYLNNHWAKGTGDISNFIKVKDSLRSHCRFERQNLLDLKPYSSQDSKYDLIFCRNVFIYFNSKQISQIASNLVTYLSENGYLFIGISETLNGLGLQVQSAGPSIYQSRSVQVPVAPRISPPSNTQSTGSSIPAQPSVFAPIQKPPALKEILRVVSVDDSASIIALLKKGLTKDSGFEVVGTAANGIEAKKVIQELKPDVVTLDIHMPECNGIDYLKRNYNSSHPPVVMLTSVSREDSNLAGQALEAGASDFVEKPTLSNLADKMHEIQTKLRSAYLARQLNWTSVPSTLDRELQRKFEITHPEQKLRILAFSIAQAEKVKKVLSEISQNDKTPTILLVESMQNIISGLGGILQQKLGSQVSVENVVPKSILNGSKIVLDLSTHGKDVYDLHGKDRAVSILVFGEISKKSAGILLNFENSQLILEDLGNGKGCSALNDVAYDIVPFTSFYYLSTEYLCKNKTSCK